MKREVQHYLNLMERRASALRLLAAGLEECCACITEMDLNGLQQAVAQQEHICAELRFLREETERYQTQFAGDAEPKLPLRAVNHMSAALTPEGARRLQELEEELAALQGRVRHSNRVQAALLHRSRRSVNILMNFLSNYATSAGASSAEGAAPPAPITVRV